MTPVRRLRDIGRNLVEGYHDGFSEREINESDVQCRYQDNNLDGLVYISGGIIGEHTRFLKEFVEEEAAHFLMGYEVAISKYNNNGLTPFAQRIEDLERIFGGRTSYDLGSLAFEIHKNLRTRLRR